MPENSFLFTNSCGAEISARIYPCNGSDRGVIFSHGLFSSKDGYKITRMASSIVSCGFNLMTYDFSFSGESSGNIRDISVIQEVDDLRNAVSEFKKRGVRNIHLMGSSMGAAVSILFCSSSVDEFESLILIAAPLDLLAIIPGMTPEKAASLNENGSSLISGIEVSNKFIMELAKLDMPGAVKQIKVPVLLIHGREDSVVDFSNTRLFISSCTSECRQVIINDGGHNLTRDSDIAIITEAVMSWLVEFNA